MSKMNRATAIVRRAQALYPQRLAAAVSFIGTDPPYGKERIDRATADRQLLKMPPQELAALAQSDPQAYIDAQKRLGQLSQNAQPIPGQDAFEPER